MRQATTWAKDRNGQIWRSVYGVGTEEVCELIRRDKVDILIELTGHTAGNRLDVMVRQHQHQTI
jgi:predicted O-linked N-acetylglucosamine transferase (SPINDLY family)